MKTIEEAKDDCINYGCLKYRESYCTAVYANGIDYGFEAGVEFAQRWISVEEELPSIGDHILIKLKRDKLKIWKIFNEDDRILVSNYATHWRPIEIK